MHESGIDDVTDNDEDEEEHLGEALDDAEETDLGVVAREVDRIAFLIKHNEKNCHN